MPTNTILTISRSGFDPVEVQLTNVEHNVDTMITDIPMPGKNVSDALTYLINLGRVKEAVTFDGILLDEASSPAINKKAELLAMVRDSTNGKVAVTANWGGYNYCSIGGSPTNKYLSQTLCEAAGGSWTTVSPSVENGHIINGDILKFSITETPERIGDTGVESVAYRIKIVIMRGTPK